MSLKMDAAHTLITNAAQNGEWGKVSTYLKTVRQEMNRARSTFPNENGLSGRVISFIPPGSLLTHAHSLVNRASQLSGYGADITEQMSPLTQNTPGTVLESEKTAHTLVNTAQTVHTHLPDITRTLKGTHTDLSQLPAWLLPASARQQVTRAREVIPAVNGLLADSRDYLNIFLEFAGQEYKRRYLFVFQNNQEVRATGGFIGTFGVMDVYQGEVERIDIQSIYDADGQLRENVVPPKPLQALTRRWHLRDANWFADFPTSAQRIIQFYEQTGGPTVDGVIALTPPIVRDLVEVVGPIEMPKYNTTVTAEKFVRIVQHETSIAYDKEKNDPKAFINDLAPKLLQRMFQADKDTYQELAQVIAKGARRKQMLLYAQEDSVQNTLEQYNLSGSVYKTKKDYLAVINSNIGGKKTDGVIEQRIKQNVSIREDGRVVSEVTVTRIHNGGNTKYPRWNAVNKDYMRIFVPQGSTLIEARGFDNYKLPKEREYTGAFETDSRLRAINQTRESHSKYHLTQSRQHKKTVFAGWTVTPPQKQSKVTLTYELPFKISADKKDMYSLIVQKQAGTSGSRYELTVEYPSDYALPWHTSSFDTTTSESKIRARTILRTDQYLGTTFVP